MRSDKPARAIIPILLVFLLCMVVAGFAYIVIQARANDRTLIAYNAGQAAAAAAEIFAIQGNLSASEAPKGLESFAIYGPAGEIVFRYGEAPDALPAALQSRTVSEFLDADGAVRIVRPFGGPGYVPGRFAEGGGFSGMMRSRRSMPGSQNGSNPMGIGGGRLTLYAVYRQTEQLTAERLRDGILVAAGALFVALVGTSYVLIRRLDRYREERESQRQMVQLGEAARTLAHEIKNPLGAIRLQQAILARSAPAELQNSVTIIREEVARVSSLTDRVREFLRNPKGSPELIDLCLRAREVASRQAFPIDVTTADCSCLVRVDPDRIHSVITNLLNNAWESMAPPAMDSIPGDGEEHAIPVELIVECGRHSVQLRVRDRGPGIPPEVMRRMFDPFFTTKDRGTGVGLAITRSFVEGAGGTVAAVGRTDGGTEFVVELPREV